MIPFERRSQILEIVHTRQTVSISELAQELDVSHMTVRRDIARLANEGKVMAVSGGVQALKPLHQEPPHGQKALTEIKQKEAIGQYAASLVPPDAVIYLDAGTTCLKIAEHLTGRDDLLIITNDFYIANQLIQANHPRCYHTGGKIDCDNYSCVGSAAAAMLQTMNIDIAFISSSSWDQKGISTPSEEKVMVKKAACKAANKVILASDASKYGRIAAFNILPLSAFDLIVTDAGFDKTQVAEIENLGCQIIRV